MRDLTEAGHDRPTVAYETLVADLRRLGVGPGQSVLVHASLRGVGRVEGGAATLAAALRKALGAKGTIVVPALTPGNSDSSETHRRRTEGLDAAALRRFRAAMPAFDPDRTPSTGMGAFAEHIRTSPEAARSAHPQTSFAALGDRARALTDGHAEDCHLGEASPLARLYEHDARVLLIGVGYEACTALHLAEYRYIDDPPRRSYRCVVRRDGRPVWWTYEDVVLDAGEFPALGDALDGTPYVTRGTVGAADTRLLPLRQAVDFACGWMAAHRKP